MNVPNSLIINYPLPKIKKNKIQPILFSMIKKTINYTQSELKTAYQIVQADLFNSLLKVKDGQSLRVGSLGKLTKSERKQRCG